MKRKALYILAGIFSILVVWVLLKDSYFVKTNATSNNEDVISYNSQESYQEDDLITFLHDLVREDLEKSFDIDLTGYKYIQAPSVQLDGYETKETVFNESQYGSTVPQAYIKDNQGYLALKHSDGTNVLWEIQQLKNEWIIKSKETEKGKPIPEEELLELYDEQGK